MNKAKMALCASLLCLAFSNAAAAVFNIDPTRSSIGLSGNTLGFPFQEQSAGSLTTKFSGAINATLTDTAIAFQGSSIISAQNNGNWEPKARGEPGSEPANFGGKASGGVLGSVFAAVRNAQLDMTSSTLPITATHFDSRSLLFQFIPNSAGSLDYSVSGFVSTKGAIALAGLATNRVTAEATLTTSGNIQTLTIPLTADFFFKLVSAADTKLTITGQIVATRIIDAGEVLLDNGNILAVQSGPTKPTTFTVTQPTIITYIQDYHYLNNGTLPGTIGLRHQDGTEYGPWQARGLLGQGGAQNAYWIVEPGVQIKAGTYTVMDSNPATWSHNSASGFAGFSLIKGYPAEIELPRLSITREADGRIALSWPVSTSGYLLFETPTIGLASGWSGVIGNPALEGDRFVIRTMPGSRARFYRLASQPTP